MWCHHQERRGCTRPCARASASTYRPHGGASVSQLISLQELIDVKLSLHIDLRERFLPFTKDGHCEPAVKVRCM